MSYVEEFFPFLDTFLNKKLKLLTNIIIKKTCRKNLVIGFFGKLFIFRAAIDANLVPLAIVGGLSSVVGAFYYLRLVYLIYFGEVTNQLAEPMPLLNRIILTSSGVAMIIGSINLFGLQGVISAISVNFVS